MRASSSRREGHKRPPASRPSTRSGATPSTGQSFRLRRRRRPPPPRPKAYRSVAASGPDAMARNRSLANPADLTPPRRCKTFSRPPFPLISRRCNVRAPVVPSSCIGRFFHRRSRRVLLLLLLLCAQTSRVPNVIIIQPKMRLNVYLLYI